ncbi:BrnT family toxin [Chelativorans sp.]|uniref:BrnT family toxin n=1 Tax=Chelativorans sp. TaxID=2203393 RepID=UPI0028112A7A|nr:BrnT family toxin [Chelativorans sp.]
MKKPSRFSSDPAKNARNVAERGIDFSAANAFEFETAVVAVDDRKDYGEVRKVAAGFIGPRLHILVFTMRGETCHVISLRKANKREIRSYVRKIEENG